MRSEAFARFVARLYDAALAPELWPAVLRSLTDAVGTLGAAYLVIDKRSGRIEWLSLVGFGIDAKADYLDYYAARDPYRPLIEAAPVGEWVQLSRCLPQSRLRRDEWYNDFITKLGIGDMLGNRVFDSAGHTLIGETVVPNIETINNVYVVSRETAERLLRVRPPPASRRTALSCACITHWIWNATEKWNVRCCTSLAPSRMLRPRINGRTRRARRRRCGPP